jgi:tight adherence protein C
MYDQPILILCAFGAAALLAYWAASLALGGDATRLRQRLETAEASPREKSTRIKSVLERLGHALATPFLPKTRERQSQLRKNLGLAGIYSPSAVKMITSFKVLLLAGGLMGGYAVGIATDSMLLSLPVGGLVGYLLPGIWLKLRIRQNQQMLDHALPDALDLMVVCIEAGLTIDSAMQRIGQELAIAHPTLSRELGIAHMETRVGLSRSECLRNLGQRTGTAGLQSLAAMLIQAERFGTSIATALRIHAESMRLNRQHAAEELAAKAAVKMTFPLVLFIFPATFIVLAGPTVIDLMNSSF